MREMEVVMRMDIPRVILPAVSSFPLSMQGGSGGYNGFAGRHGDGRTELPDVPSYSLGQGYILSHAMDAGATYGDTQIVQNGQVSTSVYSNLPTNGLMFDAETPKFTVGSSLMVQIEEMWRSEKYLSLVRY